MAEAIDVENDRMDNDFKTKNLQNSLQKMGYAISMLVIIVVRRTLLGKWDYMNRYELKR